MKKILFSLLAVCLILSCTNKKQFEIVVNAEEGVELSENAVIALTYMTTIEEKDSLIKITAPFVERKATITASVDDIYKSSLYLLDSEEAEISGRPLTSFYLENTKYEITLTGDEKKPVQLIGGGEIQKVVDSLANIREEIFNNANIDSLRAAVQANPDNQELKDSLRNIYQSISEQLENVGKDYLKLNPTSVYALFNNLDNANYISIDSLKKVVDLFGSDGKLAKSKAFERIKKLYDKRATLAPGNAAPDFTLNDVNGQPVTLSDIYKENKITMIDFWASWCGPCRRFNPTLTQIYAKYHDKGFEIFGVSLDKEQEKWVEAIKADGLNWIHVSDLAFWDCEAAGLYNIKYIPQSYFVDSEGKILLASPEEEEIEKFLEENLQ